jgi:hypothetical protein
MVFDCAQDVSNKRKGYMNGYTRPDNAHDQLTSTCDN